MASKAQADYRAALREKLIQQQVAKGIKQAEKHANKGKK